MESLMTNMFAWTAFQKHFLALDEENEVKETFYAKQSLHVGVEASLQKEISLNHSEKYKDLTGPCHSTWSHSLRRDILQDISKLSTFKLRKEVLQCTSPHKSLIHSVLTNI
jgi:Ulp1 family protease